MKKLILLFTALFAFQAGIAQDQPARQGEELNSDRPRKSDGAKVVPQGSVQLEMGFNVVTEKSSIYKNSEYHLPETLVRFGLFSFAELRVQGQLTHTRFNFVPFPYSRDITTTGISDIYVGTKLQLLKNKGLRPDLAFQADFKLPVGRAEFTGTKVEPELRLNFNNKLSDKLDLQYNIGLKWVETSPFKQTHQYDRIGLLSLAVNYKFAENLLGFIEALSELEEHYYSQSFGFGLAHKLMPNLQLDAYTGFGLSKYAPDFFASAGVSFRLPK